MSMSLMNVYNITSRVRGLDIFHHLLLKDILFSVEIEYPFY